MLASVTGWSLAGIHHLNVHTFINRRTIQSCFRIGLPSRPAAQIHSKILSASFQAH